MQHMRRGLGWVCWFLVLFSSSANADDLMASVQQKLKSLGYYAGVVDGVYGSQTAAAIRRYQLANKLKITGELNRQTLEHLGFEHTERIPQKNSLTGGRWRFSTAAP